MSNHEETQREVRWTALNLLMLVGWRGKCLQRVGYTILCADCGSGMDVSLVSDSSVCLTASIMMRIRKLRPGTFYSRYGG
jgi:hypothetical protein